MAHRSLIPLRVAEDESDLASRSRLFRLYISKNFMSMVASTMFLGVTVILLGITLMIAFDSGAMNPVGPPMIGTEWWTFLGFMGLCTIVMGGGAVVFGKEVVTDPILIWMFRPDRYAIGRGKASIARYQANTEGRRTLDRIRVSFIPEGAGISCTETFMPDIRIFNRAPDLPFHVYMLIGKNTRTRSALIGVPATIVDRREAVKRARNRKDLRKILIFFGAGLLLSFLVRWLRGDFS